MNSDLWKRLQAFDLDEAGVALCFSDRLARENGWSGSYARRVVEEYKRFLYLCVEAGHPVTPSDEVDQAWHLHLCYTRSYWEKLCNGVLGRKIHHGPTQGGSSEDGKFRDWHQKTLESYRRSFAQEPPGDIWPSVEERFRPATFRRVDVGRAWLISKRAAAVVVGFGVLSLLAVGCDDISADGMPSFWVIFAIVVGLGLVVRLFSKGGGGGPGGCGGFFGCGGDSGCGSDGGSSGCGGGGCGGGGD
jgi:hypothetical protein